MSYPWFFYLLASCAASTAFVGLLFLVACMKKYDATFSSAMFVGSFVVSASIMSAVHYSTFQNLYGIANYVLYPSGLLVLMVGVGILVRNTSPSRRDVLECSNQEVADGYRGDVLECDGDDADTTCCRRDMVSDMSCLVTEFPSGAPSLLPPIYSHLAQFYIFSPCAMFARRTPYYDSRNH